MKVRKTVLALAAVAMLWNVCPAQVNDGISQPLLITDPRPDVLPSLTLDQCLSIALSESPTVKVADMEVKRMDYSKRDVIAQLLPAIDFGAPTTVW
ncbi:MAG: hypothetical protein K2F79_02610 [Muribaculaceae bacterium]|nr:hypothetical protein [Muribaculaceae bacterium]